MEIGVVLLWLSFVVVGFVVLFVVIRAAVLSALVESQNPERPRRVAIPVQKPR